MDTVCHVITKLEMGGAQEVALYAVSHLDRKDYCPALVTGPGGILTDGARSVTHLDLTIVSSLVRPIHPLKDICALWDLVRVFRRIRPTIVHTHSSKAGILGRWAAWLAGVPIIVHTIHGYGITDDQPRWLQWLLVRLERLTGRVTNHWITVSQADIEKGVHWGLFTSNVSLIRPGIDPSPYQESLPQDVREQLRQELGAGPSDYLIGTVACLKPQKAPEDFVAVAKAVCAVVPRARFVLIGDGALRPQLEQLIAERGLSRQVYLAGWRRDVPAIMRVLDVFLLTSHWEGLPRVILEARATGLPIVATKTGGTEEAAPHGGEVYLREIGDISGLAENVLQALETKEESHGEKISNRTSFPKEFTLDEMLAQYEGLYRKLKDDVRPPLSS